MIPALREAGWIFDAIRGLKGFSVFDFEIWYKYSGNMAYGRNIDELILMDTSPPGGGLDIHGY